MIELSRFQLYYFSEVHADILYRYRPEYDTYKISATHPRVSISDWFQFIESDVTQKDDPLFFESEDHIEPVAKMANKLSPGAEHILEARNVADPRRQFFSDFMTAMATGEYNVNDGRSEEYIHPAGDWLLEEYEKLKEVE